MAKNYICRVLEMHSVPYFEKDGRIFADSMLADAELFEEVEDVTDWSKSELYCWLGY